RRGRARLEGAALRGDRAVPGELRLRHRDAPLSGALVGLTAAGLVVLGYLAGSIPFGVLLTGWFANKDVRAAGSGNIGATNVARVAGKKIGAVVLLLDAAKGALPVVLAMHLQPAEYRVHVAVALAAFLGHVSPGWLKLKGGE